MKFDLFFPTKLISGFGAVKANASALCLGKSAFIVTGKRSAKACGALDDVTAVLNEAGITYTVFSDITENPPIMTCYAGGDACKKSGADFLICDEISTMLDVITQAQIWAVVLREAKKNNMGIIAVTHNRHLADRIATRVYDLSKQR